MSDAICRKCSEPWELFYLAHEAMWDFPGADAPKDILDLHHKLMQDDEDAFNLSESFKPDVYNDYGGQRLQHAVLRGEGCPSCWADPSRRHSGDVGEELSIQALEHNLFDSGWDGDPAELF